MNLELQATPEEVMRAVEAFQSFARARGVPEEIIFGLALALEECGSNIVNHALGRGSRLTFQVKLECSDTDASLELRDPGPPFDPTSRAERKPGVDNDEVPGGWGIPLVRRYTDEMRYERQGDENVLRLTRRLTA